MAAPEGAGAKKTGAIDAARAALIALAPEIGSVRDQFAKSRDFLLLARHKRSFRPSSTLNPTPFECLHLPGLRRERAE